MIYLDNAATGGKKPREVTSAVMNALNSLCANPGRSGHALSAKAGEVLYSVRKKSADFFGADGPENVIFTKNCTEAINTVIKCCLKKGDRVVVSSLEHNSVMRPLEYLRANGQIEYDVAEVVFGDGEATYRAFEKLVDNKTAMVICTHASNVTGEIMPVEKIGALCKKTGVLFTVDAAQTAGVLRVNAKELNADYICVAPHKGLFAPMGVGLLIANRQMNRTLIQGGTGSDSVNLLQAPVMPEGFESGTVNLPGIAGLGAGLDFIQRTGIENIYEKENLLCTNLYEKLLTLKDAVTYTQSPKTRLYAPLIPFNIQGLQSEKAAALLSKNGVAVRGGLHCAPLAHNRIGTIDKGAVRVSVGYFNTQKEIDMLYNIIKNIKNA